MFVARLTHLQGVDQALRTDEILSAKPTTVRLSVQFDRGQ